MTILATETVIVPLGDPDISEASESSGTSYVIFVVLVTIQSKVPL